MYRILNALVATLALLGMAGCGALMGAPSPEAALRASDAQRLQQLAVLGQRQSGNKALILYQAVDAATAAPAPMTVLGYSYLERGLGGWRVVSGGSFGSSEPAPPDQVLELSWGSGSDGLSTVAVVHGRALDPRVVAVEATFDNGRTVRDEVTNGVFGVFMPGAAQTCAVRALDADDGEVPLPEWLAPAGC